MHELKLALSDFMKSMKLVKLWFFLGNLEIKQKYRRSTIGPWWITISMVVFMLAMSIVFSKVFKEDMSSYLPKFAAGYIFWNFFSTCLVDASEIFKQNASYIKQIDLPHPLYIFKHLTKHVIILLHNLVVYITLFAIFRPSLNINMLLIVPGLILFMINIYWLTLITSMICTRFRDVSPIIANFMQIAFFVTPISWSSKLLNTNSLILKLNPINYLIDVVRSPLLSEAPNLNSWIILSCLALTGSCITFIIYAKKRSLIPFWIN